MSKSAIAVMEAAPADAPDIVRMIAALSRHDGDPDDLFTLEAATADLFGAHPWLSALMARRAGAVAGTLLWHWAYETSYASRGAYVASLFVEPEHRRKGVATALIGVLAARVLDAGGGHLWWASKPKNAGAHATYDSVGAYSEGVIAHALFGERFETLAGRYRTIGGLTGNDR